MAKSVRVGLKVESKPGQGFQWSVYYLPAARNEALGFLSDEQYAHAVDLLRALATEPDPTHPLTVSVRSVEKFYELRDKGGVLGKINLRVFFAVDTEKRAIVVLGAFKKEEDGQTPQWVKIKIRGRLRKIS